MCGGLAVATGYNNRFQRPRPHTRRTISPGASVRSSSSSSATTAGATGTCNAHYFRKHRIAVLLLLYVLSKKISKVLRNKCHPVVSERAFPFPPDHVRCFCASRVLGFGFQIEKSNRNSMQITHSRRNKNNPLKYVLYKLRKIRENSMDKLNQTRTH